MTNWNPIYTIYSQMFKLDICQETFESEMLFVMHNLYDHSRKTLIFLIAHNVVNSYKMQCRNYLDNADSKLD
jgi:hypothetical protein